MFYLPAEAVLRNLPWDLAIELGGEALRLQAEGLVDQPLRGILRGEDALMGTMPVRVVSGRYAGFGVKSVLVDTAPPPGTPSHSGLVVVYGEPGTGGIAALDAGAITRIRTAAASAHATRMLARPDARVLSILGTGVQARAHVLAMLRVRPFAAVTVWGRDAGRTARFCAWCRALGGLDVRPSPSPAEAVRGSDVVCTVTAARAPLVRAADLPEGAHVNAVGASAPGFQELDADVYARVALYTDANAAALAGSQCLQEAAARGIVDGTAPGIEIGALRAPPSGARRGPTLFKSVGLAVQDVVAAREAVRREVAARGGPGEG